MKRLFIVTLTNSIRFDQTGYDVEKTKLVPESKFRWHPIRSQLRTEEIYEIMNTELRLQDSQFLALGDVSEVT